MRRLIVHEFISLDGVIQAPVGKDEDRDGGFEHGGWTLPHWHDDMGAKFGALMQNVDAFLLGRKTYVTHAAAFEPMPPGDPFGDMMTEPGKNIMTDGSSQLVHELLAHDLVDELHLHVYPLTLGRGKRLFADGVHSTFRLTEVTPYPSGVVGLHYERDGAASPLARGTVLLA